MDCMEGMKEFPDKYFDLAIVDPPYGDGWGAHGNAKTRADSAECSTGIARTGFHGKVYSHGRNMGKQVRQKNHFVGYSPETRIFQRIVSYLTKPDNLGG